MRPVLVPQNALLKWDVCMQSNEKRKRNFWKFNNFPRERMMVFRLDGNAREVDILPIQIEQTDLEKNSNRLKRLKNRQTLSLF